MISKLHQLLLANMDADEFSISGSARPVEKAELLWMNPRIAELDPAFAEDCVSDHVLYRRHLLEKCAIVLDPNTPLSDANTVHFDRYGGDGVGRNGGSGRACNLYGYSVKGVGRSSLVSPYTDVTHATGWAFLEEAVREVIYSESLNAVLKEGVSPIFAVIGLNENIEWPLGSFPPCEQRVLIVRPRTARIAHLEQAFTYRPSDPVERTADLNRVRGWINLIRGRLSVDETVNDLTDAYVRWARTYARCLSRRWALGGLSPSNVAIDGQCLDFGGASRLPSIANYSIGYGAWTWDEVTTITRSANNAIAALLQVPSHIDCPHPAVAGALGRIHAAFLCEIAFALDLIPWQTSESEACREHYCLAEDVGHIARETVRFLSDIRLPLNIAGGPQLETVRHALAHLREHERRFTRCRGIRDRLVIVCAASSRRTAAGALPFLHRERLRRFLHQSILDLGRPNEGSVTDLVGSCLTFARDDDEIVANASVFDRK